MLPPCLSWTQRAPLECLHHATLSPPGGPEQREVCETYRPSDLITPLEAPQPVAAPHGLAATFATWRSTYFRRWKKLPWQLPKRHTAALVNLHRFSHIWCLPQVLLWFFVRTPKKPPPFFSNSRRSTKRNKNYNQRSKDWQKLLCFYASLYRGFQVAKSRLAPRQLLRSGKNCTRSLVCGTMMCWMFTICSTEPRKSVTIGWDVRDVDELSGVSAGWILGDLNWYWILWFKIKLQRSSGIFFHDVPSQAIINQVCPKVLSTNLTFCSFQSPPFISTLNPCLGKGHIGPYTIIQWLHG